jgi:hypothetical protein
MIDIREIHHKAMALIHEADAALREHNTDAYKELSRQAFELEKEAAMLLVAKFNAEPTRAVLFRSAGWMAYNAEMYKEARQMAYFGLSGNTYTELREELESLLKKSSESLNKITNYRQQEDTPAIVQEPVSGYEGKVIGITSNRAVEYISRIGEQFIGKYVANERIRRFLAKRSLKSTNIDHDITLSIWYSKEFIESIMQEMEHYGYDGLRFYFGTYEEDHPDYPNQNCLVIIPTRFIEGDTHEDIILEDQADFAARLKPNFPDVLFPREFNAPVVPFLKLNAKGMHFPIEIE